MVTLLFVVGINILDDILELLGSLPLFQVEHGLRLATHQPNCVILCILLGCLSNCTSEYISVLLLWEIHTIVTVRVRVLHWVVPVILPCTV